MMAEISPQSLIPRAEGPVASLFLMAPAGGRTALLKVYPQPLDRRTCSAIENEQARLAGLGSVRSILLVDSLDELPDGRTGLRMEFCPQGLTQLVAAGPLPIGDVIVLAQILATVLAEAHGLGLVHGGVTPANVLERSNGQPVLTDFGVALRLRFPRDLMGDAAFTAPEVLRDGELSEPADVYGLGAVVYLALTGHSPVPARTGETANDVVLRVLREPVPQVSGRDVPSALVALLHRMLAKEPNDRPSAGEAARQLEALLLTRDEPGSDDLDFDDFRDELAAGRATQLGRPPVAVATVTKASKPRRRWKKPSQAAIAAGFSVVALLAVVLVMALPGQDPVGEKQAAPQPTNSPALPSPTAKSAVPAVQLKLKPPKDNGTSVLLEWTSTKPLVYAVYQAEQGGKGAQTTYKGRGTSATLRVVPGLKYCFEVQGTDATAIYVSEPVALRGATCRT